MARLKRSAGPAFVVGIDIESDRGYLVQITAKSPRSFSSLSLRHPINCRTIKKLWAQIDAYWIVHPMLPTTSRFKG